MHMGVFMLQCFLHYYSGASFMCASNIVFISQCSWTLSDHGGAIEPLTARGVPADRSASTWPVTLHSVWRDDVTTQPTSFINIILNEF